MNFVLQFCAFLMVISLSTSQPLKIEDLWMKFKTDFDINFVSILEEEYRFSIFKNNKEFIDQHNEKFKFGLETFQMGLNQFTHLTYDEFAHSLLGRFENRTHTSGVRFDYDADIPDSIDWRAFGAVTDVKNQERCGSCWAFSGVGATESHNFISTGKLVTLSEQQLVDCDELDNGCHGGYEGMALQYIHKHGIETINDYRYRGKDGMCRYNSTEVAVKVSKVIHVLPNSEEAMKNALGSIGPITIAIHASDNLKNYAGGVFSDRSCTKTSPINHSLVAVGYGSEGGIDYWLIKNSWGKTFGESGYFRMARNVDMCNIREGGAHYPVIA